MDATGHVVDRFTISHTADGIAILIRRLARLTAPADVQIGIERPCGRLVDLLLEAGHPVVPVSPNAIETWREGEVMSGAKPDAGDAAVIAEYVRLRQHRLRVAVPYCDDARASHRRAHPYRSGAEAGGGRQPARRAAGGVLARRQGRLRRRRVADQPGVPDPLPHPCQRQEPGRQADGRLIKHGYSGRRPFTVVASVPRGSQCWPFAGDRVGGPAADGGSGSLVGGCVA